eukprot:scaffold1.g5494.t1
MADDKAAKAAFKEGGKKGVDLQARGVAAMGGVVFFNIAVESGNGDLALLEKVMEGSNQPVDEAAEERKGGAGDLGKARGRLRGGSEGSTGGGEGSTGGGEGSTGGSEGSTGGSEGSTGSGGRARRDSIWESAGNGAACGAAPRRRDARARRRRAQRVADAVAAAGAKCSAPARRKPRSRGPLPSFSCPPAQAFYSAGDKQLAIYFHAPKELQASKNVTLKSWVDAVLAPVKGAEIVEESEERVKVVSKANPDAGIFPLKQRDEAIAAGFAWLRANGLVPADDSSDDGCRRRVVSVQRERQRGIPPPTS